MKILELVNVRLKPTISNTDFLAYSEQLNQWVKQQPGFEYRALTQAEDGSWNDVVFWQNMNSAKMAQQQIEQQPSLEAMMTAIDMNSLTVSHQTIHSVQACCEMEAA